MRIHLIAIGGSIMHNMALALQKQGHIISGSDDKIFEPSKSRLKKYDLLPKKIGWYPKKISNDLDIIILGMHAKRDNPELIKAQELNLPIYSFPEYIFKHSKNKKRIVISGSHGKTSVTSMIMHVLKNLNVNFDYLVGAKIDGFERMVKLTEDAPIIILEGDEYLSSCINKNPKFHLYQPDIAVLTGIAWDHINVFKTFEDYVEQFRIFKNMVKDVLIYCSKDQELIKLMNEKTKCQKKGYSTHEHKIINGETYINNYKIQVFGDHNLENINAAKLVCEELNISHDEFYKHISSFKGAANRLELIKKNMDSAIFKDFAHSPSKLKATCKAVKNQYKNRQLIACMELHTFSSLNKKFLAEYKGSMDDADIAIIYYSLDTLKNKGLNMIKKEDIFDSFNKKELLIFTDSKQLEKHLKSIDLKNKNLLMMSSGNFGDINFNELG